jgi:hypothetical protein
MKPRALAVLALAILLLVVPTAAQAKGATGATIDGGEPGSSTDLGMLAQGTGLYATVFGGDPGAVLGAAPTDRLGPATPSPGGSRTRRVARTASSASVSGRTRPAAGELHPGWSGGPGHDQYRRLVSGLRWAACAADRARPAQPQAAGPRHRDPGWASPRRPATRPGHHPTGRLAQGGRCGRRLAGPCRRGRGPPAPPSWPRPRHRPLTSAQLAAPTGVHPHPSVLRGGPRRAAGMGSQPRARPVADQDVARATTRRQRTRRRAIVRHMAAMAGVYGRLGPGNCLEPGPHPYQQNAGNRCAKRRSRRSSSTVEGEVMCSHRVQLPRRM